MSMTVLVCDDSLLARKQVLKCLPSLLDATYRTATNGLEALTILRSEAIDLLFLDLTMPELDGIGVLHTIRNEQFECLVIVISADIQPEMQRRVKELGALAFINKPVQDDKLNAVLKLYGLI